MMAPTTFSEETNATGQINDVAVMLEFFISARCSLSRATSLLEVCPVYLLTVLALNSVDSQGLFTPVNSTFDTHQSGAQSPCWVMRNSKIVWFEETDDCF